MKMSIPHVVRGFLAATWALALAMPVLAGDDYTKATPAWQYKGKKKLDNFMEVLDGKGLFTRDGDYLTVIDPASGTVKWEKKLEGFKDKAFRIVWNGNMYIYGTKKEMVALNLSDGSEKYRLAVNKDVDPTEYVDYINTTYGALLIYQDAVAFYDLTDGKELWVRKDKNMTRGSYTFFGNGNFLAFYSKEVHMVDYKTGQTIWKRNDSGFTPGGYNLLASGNFLIFYAKDVQLVDFNSGNTVYSAKEPATDKLRYSWAVRSKDPNAPVVLFLNKRTALVNSKDGRELWSSPSRGSEELGGPKTDNSCATFIANSVVVFLEKQVVGVNLTSGQVMWTEDVKDKDDIGQADAYAVSDDQGIETGGAIILNGACLMFDGEGKKLWRTADNTLVGQVCKIVKLDESDYMFVTGKRAFLMTAKDLGVHMYRMSMKDGTVKYHAQTRAGWSSVIGRNAKTTFEGVAAGPFIYKDMDMAILMTNMGTNVFRLSDGKFLKDGKWIETPIGKWNTDFTLDKNLMYMWTYTPPVQGANIVNIYANAFASMRNTTFSNLNPDPIVTGDMLYLAGDEKVWAVDLKTGKKMWETKTGGPVVRLPFSRGMIYQNGVVYCRTGIYLDQNILEGSRLEKPAVYADKGDFGFVAVDAKSGKVLWKVQDFDKADPEYLVDMITDEALAKQSEKSNCKLKNLKIGFVNLMIDRPTYRLMGGGDGMAGITGDVANPCKSSWKIKDGFDKAWAAENLSTGQSAIVTFIDNIGRVVICSNNNIYLFDEKTQSVKWKAKREGGDVTVPFKLSEKNGLIMDIDGKEMTAYRVND